MKNNFFQYCLDRQIVLTSISIKVALVVGTILALINHFDSIVTLSLGKTQIIQILITYFVPYCVATFGGAKRACHTADEMLKHSHVR